MKFFMGAEVIIHVQKPYRSPVSYETSLIQKLELPFFVKKEASCLLERMVFYDTGHVFTEKLLQDLFHKGSGAMQSLLKANCRFCTENVAAKAKRSIFNDIVSPRTEKVLMLSKRWSEK